MPTYVVTTRTGLLKPEQMSAIAAALSKAHHEATGAPTYFVQVVFDEKDPGRRFLGGAACDGHIWVRGDIRSGRTTDQRTALMQSIMREAAAITGIAETEIWVYLCELVPTDMIEYGHVLPAPGAEQTWFERLPAALRDRLEQLGLRAETFKL